MRLPTPRPGLVIRYGFLWSHEADNGADEAAKDRPCAIIVATQRGNDDDLRVIVAPITHRPPADTTASIEISAGVCRQLGLDGQEHWLRVDELNRFSWPGYDLKPIPGRGTIEYGLLPQGLFEELRTRVIQRQRSRQGRRPIDRD
ncbi:hypothetical protein DRB17_11710 [Ferruginivarius sediminum]|uniref:Growth inhibitor PemK n=1 Tax=Ferruginivarius sediminum TaxID=2661937 RepID=A0A369TB40_9PROT|nr:hypothetical protein DRB17_11710 [Ferruginivarius sediminum]